MTTDSVSFLTSLPESASLVCLRSERSLSGKQILDEVRTRARRLTARGLLAGNRVVVGHVDAFEYLLDILACWTGSLCAVAVNPRLSREEKINVLQHVDASAWLGDDEADCAWLDDEIARCAPPFRGAPSSSLILMTSGTTGQPKGVVHTQRSLLARIQTNIAAIGETAMQHSLCVLPVYFGHGLIGNCLTPLMAGARVLLLSSPSLAETSQLGKLIDRHTVTFMSSVPAFWRIALRVASKPAHTLTRIHVGSSPLPHDLWRSIAYWSGSQAVYNMYGMTEAANWIAGSALSEARGREAYVGKSWGDTLAVYTDEGNVSSCGAGEILLKSSALMTEYWRAPDTTQAAFIEGWFRTGDVGQIDADGSLLISGRLKSEINCAGVKVLAEEIDALLERHAEVSEACAFALPDPVSGECVAVAVVLRQGADADPDDIKTWCAQRIRPEAVPGKIFVVTQIMRNDRGKLDRAAMRDSLYKVDE